LRLERRARGPLLLLHNHIHHAARADAGSSSLVMPRASFASLTETLRRGYILKAWFPAATASSDSPLRFFAVPQEFAAYENDVVDLKQLKKTNVLVTIGTSLHRSHSGFGQRCHVSRSVSVPRKRRVIIDFNQDMEA
jgi:hypothetical protein